MDKADHTKENCVRGLGYGNELYDVLSGSLILYVELLQVFPPSHDAVEGCNIPERDRLRRGWLGQVRDDVPHKLFECGRRW